MGQGAQRTPPMRAWGARTARRWVLLPRPRRLGPALIGCLVALTPATASAASVSNGTATNITGSRATLSSQVVLDGNVDRCYFQVRKGGSNFPSTSTPVPCSTGTFTQDVGLDSAGSYTFKGLVCESRGQGNTCPFGPSAVASGETPFKAPGPTSRMAAATKVSGTGATVSVTVDTRGNPSVRTMFQYSLDPTFQTFQETPARGQLDSNSPPTVVTDNLVNLDPGTTYYVRARVFVEAASPQDWYSDNSISFRTGRYAQTLPATAIAATTATLNGELNAGDVTLSYRWYYGSDASAVAAGTSPSTPAATAAPGETTTPVSASVAGLTPGTTYSARLVATYTDPANSQARTISGAIVTFGTQTTVCPAGQTKLERTPLPQTPFVATGCFDGAGGSPTGPYVGHGTVLINGLTFTPNASSGTLRIDPGARQLTTSMPTGIAIGVTRIRVAGATPYAASWSAGDGAFQVGGLDLGSKLLGFPLGGSLTATPLPTTGGARIVVTAITLPNQLGGSTAEATVVIDSAGKTLSGQATLGGAEIGPILLPSVSLSWKSDRVWTAKVDARIPLLEQGIGAEITIVDNRLTAFKLAFASPVGVPLGSTGITLDYLSAGADFAPPGFKFTGELGGAAGPSIGKFSLLRLDTIFDAAVARRATVPGGLDEIGLPEGQDLGVVPFAFHVGGTFKLLNVIPVGSANFYYWGTGRSPLVALKGSVGLDLKTGSCAGSDPAFQLKVGGGLGVAFNATQFNLAADVQAKLRVLCFTLIDAGAKFVASTKGIAVCGYLQLGRAKVATGVGAKWPSGDLTTSALLKNVQILTACDLSPYTTQLKVGDARAASRTGASAHVVASGGDKRVRIAGGTRSVVLRITGRGGAPRVVVIGPGGRTVRADAPSRIDKANGTLALVDDRDDRHETFVQFAVPRAGIYRIRMLPGSPAIARVSTARQLAPAAVRATVSGKGAARTLRWNATGVAGQQLVFRERGPGGDRVILRTTKTRGTVRFRPSLGAAGRRTIVLDVFNQGYARTTLRAARFSVAAPARPSKVARLRLIRKGSTAIVTWRARGGAVDHYEVRAILGDGRRLVRALKGRKLTIAGVGGVKITLTVRGQNALGVRGPVVTGKL